MKKALLLLILISILAACGPLGSQDPYLMICSSLPLARDPDTHQPTNSRALSMSRAIQQAIEEQNERGGVLSNGVRYKLRYTALDDTSQERGGSWDPAQEARNARAAIAEHECVAYIGTYNSGAAKVAIPILNRVQMLMISPGNTYPGLTKPGTGVGDEPWIYYPLGPEQRNYCRVVPSDDLQAPAAARYAARELGAKRAFIFHDTELYGKGLAELFEQAAREEGMELAAPIHGFNARADDPNALAARILDLEPSPDLVYFGGVTANQPAAVLKALRDGGYEGFFMGADGIAEEAFLQEADPYREGASDQQGGIYATLVGLPPEELPEEGQQWQQRYLQRYNERPDAFAAPSYEATLVVIDAIERAQLPAWGEANFLERVRPAILNAARETKEFQGILGPWSFDENCDTTATTISVNRADGWQFVFERAVADHQ